MCMYVYEYEYSYVQVREFASNWRTGIQQINDNVLAYFANFRNGMEILKQVLFFVFAYTNENIASLYMVILV